MQRSNRPAFVELFAGHAIVSRAFAERGWRVLAIDTKRRANHLPTSIEWLQADITAIEHREIVERIGWPAVVWASPPCTDLTGMKQYAAGHRPEQALELIAQTRRLIAALKCPHILENVHGAQRWLGPSVAHYGHFHLWGDGVPLIPKGPRWKSSSKLKRHTAAGRAEIPVELAAAIAAHYTNVIEHR